MKSAASCAVIAVGLLAASVAWANPTTGRIIPTPTCEELEVKLYDEGESCVDIPECRHYSDVVAFALPEGYSTGEDGLSFCAAESPEFQPDNVGLLLIYDAYVGQVGPDARGIFEIFSMKTGVITAFARISKGGGYIPPDQFALLLKHATVSDLSYNDIAYAYALLVGLNPNSHEGMIASLNDLLLWIQYHHGEVIMTPDFAIRPDGSTTTEIGPSDDLPFVTLPQVVYKPCRILEALMDFTSGGEIHMDERYKEACLVSRPPGNGEVEEYPWFDEWWADYTAP